MLAPIDELLLRNLLRDTLPAVTAGILSMTGLALLCWLLPGGDSGDYPTRIALWWAALLLGQVGGLALGFTFRRAPADPARLGRLHQGLLAVQLHTSVMWGAAAWLLLPAPSLTCEAFVLVALAMVVPGGAGMMATYRRVYRLTIGGMVIVGGLGILRLGGVEHVLMAAGLVMLGIVVHKNCAGQERAVRAALASQMRTAQALDTLASQQLEIESARQLAEQARHQAEAANQAKTAFLAAASHDLRQPMHAIVQYFAHVRRHNRDERLAPALEHGAQALESMQDLLDSVLEVSKLMMGGIVPEPRHLDLRDALRRLEAQLQPMASEVGLDLRLAAPAPCWVHTDAVLIERILRNLAMNALRYTPKGGVILQLKQAGSWAQLSVADTGIGIAASDLERVFEPFMQLGNPARDRNKGLGLGLTIVRELCALLGARLRVRSRPGAGSVFTLRLPLAAGGSVDAAATNPAEWRDLLTGALVLLIDDDAVCREATALTLRDLGCQVVAAASSAQALADPTWGAALPNVILSDYRLEHETGLEAIARIRQAFDTRFGDHFALPSLIFTGDTAPEHLERVRAAGLVALHKPVHPDALRHALERELATLAGLSG